MTGQAGTVLGGRYRLSEPIGRGGMGTVWRATDMVLDREVAIKILVLQLAGDPDASARFRREARLLARLSHPRLGGVYDYGEENGQAFTVMEFLTGETLQSRLARVGRVPYAEAAEIAAQVAEGLHAAHQAGVIHRDVKPANIILTGQGVKLVDFGIALGAGDDRLTITGTLVGSATYLAPERCTGHPATAASDVYSLAVVLYQMLAGQPPFTAADPVELVSAHSRDPVPPLPGDVPAGLAGWCLRAMAKDPGARPAAALVFAAMLRQSSPHGRHAARPAAPRPIEPQPGAAWAGNGAAAAAASGQATITLPAVAFEADPPRLRRWWLPAAGALAALMAGTLAAALIFTAIRPLHPAATRRASAHGGSGHPAGGPSLPEAGIPAPTWVITAETQNSGQPPAPPPLLAPAGRAVRLAETLRAGTQPIAGATLGLSAPPGWTVTPETPTTTGAIPSGGTATVSWRVDVPAAAQPGGFQLVATAQCASSAPCAAAPVTGTAVVPYTSFSQAFNNVGIAAQAASAAANLDGTGQSYSAEALAAAGYLPGAQVEHDGISFAWPMVGRGAPDNVTAQGQTFLISATGAHLAFLGAADFGGSGGDGTIYYQDGTQQPFHLAMDDWWTSAPRTGQDEVAVTVPQFNPPPGQPPPGGPPVAVYFAAVPLQSGKTVQAVTLPAGAAPASGVACLHLFAVGVG